MFEHTVTVAERLDQLAFRLYSETDGIVEEIFNLNPGLSTQGFTLAPGDVIKIPQQATLAQTEVVRLWT